MSTLGLGAALPANPRRYPGLPGGPPFNWDSLPIAPDGANPTGGIKAIDKIIPAGTTRYLATLSHPRKHLERIPPDEMALMIATYNQQLGTDLPIDPMSPLWQRPGWWATREAIAKVAVGRWNAWMCRQGKGHCPRPNFFEQVSKVPALGPVLKAAASPVTMVVNVAHGERIDHALVGSFKDQVGAVKAVAPYVAAVVSFVPGVGTGVAAAIAAGAALAEGKPIGKALVEGIRAAIPGGVIAQAAFDLATKVASGENIGKAALETARGQLPPAAQKAFDIGVAVTSGKKLQDTLTAAVVSLAPGELKQVLDAGAHAVQSVPGLAALAKSLPSEAARQGLQLASGALSHAGVNEAQIRAMRSKLSGEALHGFDAALRSQEKHHPWVDHAITEPLEPPAPRVAAPAPRAASPAPRTTPKPPEPATRTPATPKPPEPHAASHAAPKPPKPREPRAAHAAPLEPQAAQATAAAAITSYRYPPYPGGALGAPPPHPHPHHPHGSPHARPIAIRSRPSWPGPWWSTPYDPSAVVTRVETCQTWGDPIEMPPAMQGAARAALGASQSRPTTVRGPDGVLYLFSFESGVLTARPCAAVATSA